MLWLRIWLQKLKLDGTDWEESFCTKNDAISKLNWKLKCWPKVLISNRLVNYICLLSCIMHWISNRLVSQTGLHTRSWIEKELKIPHNLSQAEPSQAKWSQVNQICLHTSKMLEQPQAGLIGRFYRQVENRPKNYLLLRSGNYVSKTLLSTT